MDIGGIHHSVRARANIAYLHALALQLAASIEHRGMLNGGGDYVFARG